MRIRKFTDIAYGVGVEDLIDAGIGAGYSFIEIQHNRVATFTSKVFGVDQLTSYTGRQSGTSSVASQTTSIVTDGVLRFMPDKNNHRFAYLLDTPSNRSWLLDVMSTGTYIITDLTIRNEIITMGIERGIATDEKLASNSVIDSAMVPKKNADNTTIDELRAQLTKTTADLKTLQEIKPLAGRSTKSRTTIKPKKK